MTKILGSFVGVPIAVVDQVVQQQEEIESLRQQLSTMTKERDESVSAAQRLSEGQPFDAVVIVDTVKSMTAQLEQQLAAAVAACKAKDEALRESGRLYCTMICNDFINQPSMFERPIVAKYVRGWFRHTQPSMVKNALAIQPDDLSGVILCHAEPLCYLTQTSSDRNPPHGWSVNFGSGEVPLYAPKGSK